MKVKVENIRHWVDDTFQIVVHTNKKDEFVQWLDTQCPGYSKFKDYGSSIPGLGFNWHVLSFTLTASRDIMMFKLTWK